MIKQFQKEFGIQNKELADLLGYSLSSIQKWRSGEVAIPPSVDKLIRLFSDVFDQDREALFKWNHHLQDPEQPMPDIQRPLLPSDSRHTPAPEQTAGPDLSRNCLEVIQDMMFCTDLSGSILFATPTLNRTLGCDNLTGQPFETVLNAPDRNRAADMFEKAASGSQSIFQFHLSPHQSEVISVEAEVFFDTCEDSYIMIWRAKMIETLSEDTMDAQKSSSEPQPRQPRPARS